MFAKFQAVVLSSVAQIKDRTVFRNRQVTPTDAPHERIPTPNLEYPGDMCCNIYEKEYYQGKMLSFCHTGKGESHWFLPNIGLDDDLDAFYCGKYVEFDFCDDHYEDYCGGGKGSHGAGNVHVGWLKYASDVTTTIKLRPYDPMGVGAAMTFTEPDCEGRIGRFYAADSLGYKAEYASVKEIEEHGGLNDDIESVMMPYGLAMDFFNDPGFTGTSETIVGPMWADSRLQMDCVNLDSHKTRDHVSSLKVYKTKYLGPAQGSWKSITSSQGITVTYHIGFQVSSETTDISTEQTSLSYEMHEGIEFEGSSLSSEFSATVEHDTTSSFSYDISVDWEVTCDQQGDLEGVGVWQWTVGSFDGGSIAYSTHTLCRYGLGVYDQPPACPFGACKDAMCTECVADWSV